MQEIIFYPGDIRQEKITLIQQLLLRVDLVQYQLNQTEDWYSVLSGGQKQKIKIISAIMQEPDVLILDEAFNGLDKKSIDLIQAIIIEQLPNILVISIDHSSIENNSTGFYTDSLTVAEGELINAYKNPNSHPNPNSNQHQNDLCYDLFERTISYDQKCYEYYEYNDYE